MNFILVFNREIVFVLTTYSASRIVRNSFSFVYCHTWPEVARNNDDLGLFSVQAVFLGDAACFTCTSGISGNKAMVVP